MKPEQTVVHMPMDNAMYVICPYYEDTMVIPSGVTLRCGLYRMSDGERIADITARNMEPISCTPLPEWNIAEHDWDAWMSDSANGYRVIRITDIMYYIYRLIGMVHHGYVDRLFCHFREVVDLSHSDAVYVEFDSVEGNSSLTSDLYQLLRTYTCNMSATIRQIRRDSGRLTDRFIADESLDWEVDTRIRVTEDSGYKSNTVLIDGVVTISLSPREGGMHYSMDIEGHRLTGHLKRGFSAMDMVRAIDRSMSMRLDYRCIEVILRCKDGVVIDAPYEN